MRLRELMENTKTTQQELANKLKISRQSVSLYVLERREPDINTLIKIADYFGVSVDYLIKHTPATDAEPPAPRNYIYVGGKKYDLSETPVKIEINGVSVYLSVENVLKNNGEL